MRIKTKELTSGRQPQRNVKVLSGTYKLENTIFTVLNTFGRVYRLRTLIKQLEKRKQDHLFLKDVGITTSDVDEQIKTLRRRYFY